MKTNKDIIFNVVLEEKDIDEFKKIWEENCLDSKERIQTIEIQIAALTKVTAALIQETDKTKDRPESFIKRIDQRLEIEEEEIKRQIKELFTSLFTKKGS